MNIIDTITNILYRNQATFPFSVTDIEQPYITCPDTAYVNESITFDAKKTYLPGKNIAKYDWYFGDDALGQGMIVSHKYSEPGTFRVYICAGYPTDKGQKLTFECRYKDIIVMKRSDKL